MTKDDRCGNGSRENRRPWVQRNAVWIVLISGWLFVLSGTAIRTWAQSASTTDMAEETKADVVLNSLTISKINVDLADIKANLTGAKENITEIKMEQKEQRVLLNQILRAVKS